VTEKLEIEHRPTKLSKILPQAFKDFTCKQLPENKRQKVSFSQIDFALVVSLNNFSAKPSCSFSYISNCYLTSHMHIPVTLNLASTIAYCPENAVSVLYTNLQKLKTA